MLSRLTAIFHGVTGVVDGTSFRGGPVRLAEPSDPPSRNTSTLVIFSAPVTQPCTSAPAQASELMPVNSMRPVICPHAPYVCRPDNSPTTYTSGPTASGLCFTSSLVGRKEICSYTRGRLPSYMKTL